MGSGTLCFALPVGGLLLLLAPLLGSAARLRRSAGTGPLSLPNAAKAMTGAPGMNTTTLLGHAVQPLEADELCGEVEGAGTYNAYREDLLKGICSVPLSHSERPLTCRGKIGCLLNDFYNDGCPYDGTLHEEMCNVCTNEFRMVNHSVGGLRYGHSNVEGDYFHAARAHFVTKYAEKPEELAVINDPVRGKQLCCAAMMLVKDGCAASETKPSCAFLATDPHAWREQRGITPPPPEE